MNRNYYSDSTVNKFIRENICQKDELLLKYFETEDVKRFRRRMEILKVDHKVIEKNVYAYVTDSIRDVILSTIGNLTQYMSPMGDLIVSGGEAFNTYFTRDDKIITSDIDTKFVPIFKLPNGKLLSKNSKKFFENLQIVKLVLWDRLGKIAKRLDAKIHERVSLLKVTRLGKLFGINLANNGPYVTRRYTLIKKLRQRYDTNNVTNGDVLIDVELFTLDLRMRYFSTKDSKINSRNLGGILDSAFMRPGEVGYEVAESRERGVYYYNFDNNKHVYNKNILIASKKFLLEDLYLMQSLGLRPDKKDKDRKRMYTFSKKVLKISDITPKESFESIFKKSSKVVEKNSRSRVFNRPTYYKSKYIKLIKTMNPFEGSNRTTIPDMDKLTSQFFTGLKGPSGLQLQNLNPTSGKFRVNTKTKKWVKNTRNSYIKNEYNYRPTKKFSQKLDINFSKLRPSQVLYGYNPRRNKYMSRDVFYKSAFIPLIGLKKWNNL